MVATAARIALATNEGLVLSKVNGTLKTDHPNAVGDEGEIESFFDAQADAQVLLDERWNWKSAVGRAREQIELDSSFGLGTTVAVTPTIPTVTITDETRGIIAVVAMVRAYAIDYNTERYAVELAA